jgi:hypothetical protein
VPEIRTIGLRGARVGEQMKLILTALLGAGPSLLAAPAQANDFPTQARVEYVLRCMDAAGGQNYNNLYACVCTIDRIAESLSYAEFTEAETYTLMRSTPGEQGGVFRDPDRAGELQQKYRDIVGAAEQSCFGAEREIGKQPGANTQN